MWARFTGFAIVLALSLPVSISADMVGISPEKETGTLHRVVHGDTLWDITARYLGTAWIWPSIWQENAEISNPHLIYPEDLVWITAGEMRKVSEKEARGFLPDFGDPRVEVPSAPELASSVHTGVPTTGFAESFSIGSTARTAPDWQVRFPGVERFGFIASQHVDVSGAVLGNPDPKHWVSQEDEMIVSLGEGETAVGSRYQVFRVHDRVEHPETGEVMGHFVEVVGRAQISEIHAESAFATVTRAYAEIEPGDRLAPLVSEPGAFTPVAAKDGIEGIILAQQLYRIESASGDLVVLDQGMRDGVVPGNQFVIFHAGERVPNPLSSGTVRMPDEEVGSLFVLKASERTALALVVESTTEVSPGYRFRSE